MTPYQKEQLKNIERNVKHLLKEAEQLKDTHHADHFNHILNLIELMEIEE